MTKKRTKRTTQRGVVIDYGINPDCWGGSGLSQVKATADRISILTLGVHNE